MCSLAAFDVVGDNQGLQLILICLTPTGRHTVCHLSEPPDAELVDRL